MEVEVGSSLSGAGKAGQLHIMKLEQSLTSHTKINPNGLKNLKCQTRYYKTQRKTRQHNLSHKSQDNFGGNFS